MNASEGEKLMDKLKFTIAHIAARMIYIVGKPLGKASNLPGEIALKIDKKLFSRFRFKGKILVVTGSNGKTSTANLVAYILTDNGYKVVNNAKGSNLTGGVATTLICNSRLNGYIDADYVVLEVDERFSRLIFRDFSADYMLVTNLFRDQLTRNGNVDEIIRCLHEAIKPQTKMILNGNDPISSSLAPENERVYYSMNRTEQSSDECFNITHDAKVCPHCSGKMNYEYFHYNHIGKYTCSNCGYTTPESKYIADNVNFKTGDFTINGLKANTQYRSAFNFLNTTAAVSLCAEAGLPVEKAVASASSFVLMKQRFDEFEIGDRKAVMILSKNQNPVSFDQSISYLLEAEGKKTVIVYVNNINHTFNKDTTWLYDISFDRLNNKIDSIIATGPRGYDLTVRLQYCGFNMDLVKTETDVSRLKEIVSNTKGTIYILTEIYDAKVIIDAISK